MLDPFKKGAGKAAEEQAADLQALVASSREERAALSTMLTQVQIQTSKLVTAGSSVQELDGAVTRAHERAEQVRTWLTQLQQATSALAEDLRSMHDVSRLIRDETAAVAAVAKDIEQRLGSLAKFQQLSRATDQRLATLHALAEQAARKVDTIREQQGIVDRTMEQSRQVLEQSARLNELSRGLEEQLARVEDAERRAQQTLALVGQLEQTSRESAERFDQAVAAGVWEGRLDALRRTVSDLEARVADLDAGRTREEHAPKEESRPAPSEVRPSALVDMLEDLRTSVETIAGRRGRGTFASTRCDQLRDMARDAQSTIAALEGRPGEVRSSRGNRPAFGSGPPPEEPSAPSREASSPA